MMAEAVAEKQVCEECGADVRENTAFCYNCGTSVLAARLPADDVHTSNGTTSKESETQAALDDLAERFKIDVDEDDKLAKAAAERRKARVTGKKNVRYQWQPMDENPNLAFIIATLAVTIIALIVVFLTVLWK